MFTVEDEIACYHDSPAEPNNVHLELWLPGQLDSGRLRAAVTATMAALPRARAKRSRGHWRPRYRWSFPAVADLDPVSIAAWRTNRELDDLRDSFMTAAPALDHSPLFRLLLATGPGRDCLILNAHHAAFDGRSCVLLLTEIARYYSGTVVARPAPSAALPVRATSARSAHPARFTLSGRSARIRPRRAATGPTAGYGFHLLDWPGIPTAPHGPPATVNDVLIATLIETIATWNASGPARGTIRITMPIDARPAGSTELGNLSGLCTISDGQPLLTSVARQTSRAKRQPESGDSPVLAALVRSPLPSPVKRTTVRLALRCLGSLLCDTSLVSNLGKLPDPPTFGALRPDKAWFSTTAHMPRGLSVGAISCGGTLQLCFRYRRALLDDEAAAAFAASYASTLSTLLDQPRHPSEAPDKRRVQK